MAQTVEVELLGLQEQSQVLFDPQSKVGYVTVKNLSNSRNIAFLVKTTDPQNFTVQPTSHIVEPQQLHRIRVTLTKSVSDLTVCCSMRFFFFARRA